MDPLSQGVLGAAAPQAACHKKNSFVAGLLGFFAGMAPDLDVLIRSSTDPLLFLEYHRQFTHSLVFIPLGGLICALVLHYLIGRKYSLSFSQSWIFCTLGYATHAVLDACTTYGTQLFWPFSNARIAWNVVSVVDPVFTLPVLLLVFMAAKRHQPVFARMALCWAVLYMLLGLLQHDRAVALGHELASQRGHQPLRLEAKPGFANLLLWKTVYETQDEFYVDAVRVGIRGKVYNGESIEKLDVSRDFPWLDPASQQAMDVERFRWFSNGYVALHPEHANRIIDIRYSIVPNDVNPLWGIELTPAANKKDFVRYVVSREVSLDMRKRYQEMLFD